MSRDVGPLDKRFHRQWWEWLPTFQPRSKLTRRLPMPSVQDYWLLIPIIDVSKARRHHRGVVEDFRIFRESALSVVNQQAGQPTIQRTIILKPYGKIKLFAHSLPTCFTAAPKKLQTNPSTLTIPMFWLVRQSWTFGGSHYFPRRACNIWQRRGTVGLSYFKR